MNGKHFLFLKKTPDVLLFIVKFGNSLVGDRGKKQIYVKRE